MDSNSDPKSVISGSYGRRRIIIDVGVVVAAALFDVGVASNSTGRDLDPLGFVIWGVTLGSLMWRQRNPFVVLAITASAAITFALVGYRAVNIFPFIIAMYGVVLYGRPRSQARIAAVVAGIAVLTVSLAGEGFRLEDLASNALLLVGAFAIGETVRARKDLAQSKVERAQRETEEERRRADEAIAAQRLEIARELHDIVAHSVTVMTVQLGGARLALADEPDRAREALREAERAGRMAMRELRRMLTVLRGADEDATSNIRSGDARLELLIDEMIRAGVDVTVRTVGARQQVSDALEATMFRVVQEALTNVAKHAGTPVAATLIYTWSDDAVRVEVVDDGTSAAPAEIDGFGLIGMRERVALFGGVLNHGPQPGGGFRVDALFPLEAGDDVS